MNGFGSPTRPRVASELAEASLGLPVIELRLPERGGRGHRTMTG